MRSIVCNPQLVAVCNHFEEMYVIHRRWYVINPKEDTYKAYALMTYRLQSKRITYAYRRLHTNPSDWIKNKTVQRLSYFLEAPPGFEPGRKGFADLCLTTWLWCHIKLYLESLWLIPKRLLLLKEDA